MKRLFVFLLFWSAAYGQTTDYVNPDDVDCDDTIASGSTTTTVPWCSPPGTRNAGNSATVNTNTLSCGDTVLLFGSATQDSDDPAGGGSLGYWNINATEYADCGLAAQNPITIRIATNAEWAGSNGDFTLDGTGVTLNVAGTPALMLLSGVDKVHVRGENSTNEIIVRDAQQTGVHVENSDRIWLRYMQITNNDLVTSNQEGGIEVTTSDDVTIQDMEVDNNNGRGYFIGIGDAINRRFTCWECLAHNNGNSANCPGDGGGFWVVGRGIKWFNNITSRNNNCEGLQAGVVDDGTIDKNIYQNWRNVVSISHDVQTNNQTDSQHQMSGDENGVTPNPNPTYTFGDGFHMIQTFVRFRFWGGGNQGENMQSGHGGGFTDFWNGVTAQSAGALWYYDQAADYSAGHNMIFGDLAGLATHSLVTADSSAGNYNVNREPKIDNSTFCTTQGANTLSNFDGTCSDNATIGCNRDEDCVGNCNRTSLGTAFTYNSPPEFLADDATVNIVTSDCEGIFADVSGGCSGPHPFTAVEFASCNFALEATATNEIDGGICFLYTTNSGTSSTGPINVRAWNQDEHDNFNGAYGLGDPRRFFYVSDAEGDDANAQIYAPSGSGITADAIEIGGTETTVTALTSASITVADSISWNIGDCVHLPYNGSAPDRGYLETAGLEITTTSLPDGEDTIAYSQTLTATGGSTPYTWSIVAGSLPAGLSLNSSSGAITGTPTTPGTSNFTARVTDNDTVTDDQALTIVIQALVNITTTSLGGGMVNDPYSQTVLAADGITPYSFSLVSGSLPAGLTLASSGVISGTPTTEGVQAFTVRVTDSVSATDDQALTITISEQVSANSQFRVLFGSSIRGDFLVADQATFTGAQGTGNVTLPATAAWVLAGMHLSVPSGALSPRDCRFFVQDSGQNLKATGPQGVEWHTVNEGGSLAWTGPITVGPGWIVGVTCTNANAGDVGNYVWSYWGTNLR